MVIYPVQSGHDITFFEFFMSEDLLSAIKSKSRICLDENLDNINSWPFEEAKKILTRLGNKVPEKGYILLETGYGPSGLPHIGTFGEVARTVMVKNALALLSDIPVRLFAFSDDMDGLRKVPDNVPCKEMLEKHLGKPLTLVPDPYGKYESFGHHNNAMLRDFLDSFGFSYEFQSATFHYKAGTFDKMLVNVLNHYDEIMDVMLPTLRDERRATYSPFLPICKRTLKVLQVPLEKVDVLSETIVYRDPETGQFVETGVRGGDCKLQWKVDWGGRWAVFDVDYEMSGKDLISSFALSSKICKILGGRPPENLSYELFLDQQGQKISKSKGNGLTIEEWLRYAPQESLSYYMFQTPKKAKRLYFDVIPKAVDDYLNMLDIFQEQIKDNDIKKQMENPVFHIHNGSPPKEQKSLSFNILLNLASVCGAEDDELMWGFVQRYIPAVDRVNSKLLADLITHTITYYHDFIKPNLNYRRPSEIEREAMEDLLAELESAKLGNVSAEKMQEIVFEVGKRHPFNSLKEWFQSLYEVLFGNSEGPRLGSFIALYGVDNMCILIRDKTKD